MFTNTPERLRQHERPIAKFLCICIVFYFFLINQPSNEQPHQSIYCLTVNRKSTTASKLCKTYLTITKLNSRYKNQSVYAVSGTSRCLFWKTKRRLLYLKTQSVPRCKHFSSRYKNQAVYAVSGTSRCLFWKTKRRPLYLKTQSVPRCKHFSSRL